MVGSGSRLRFLWFGLVVLLGLTPSAAFAQLGVPNPPAVPPDEFINTPPFGTQPHPLNNSHVTQPWDLFHGGLVVREYQVLPRTVVLPMEAVEPGSLPSTIEWQQVTLPGYRVTETVGGFIVHDHWEVRPVGTAYYWTFVPAHFRRK